jgi:hypothetical protein
MVVVFFSPRQVLETDGYRVTSNLRQFRLGPRLFIKKLVGFLDTHKLVLRLHRIDPACPCFLSGWSI